MGKHRPPAERLPPLGPRVLPALLGFGLIAVSAVAVTLFLAMIVPDPGTRTPPHDAGPGVGAALGTPLPAGEFTDDAPIATTPGELSSVPATSRVPVTRAAPAPTATVTPRATPTPTTPPASAAPPPTRPSTTWQPPGATRTKKPHGRPTLPHR